MSDLIELVAPGGCDEANHGGIRYRVDNDGRIRVPREAAFWFIKYGGFRPIPKATEAAFSIPRDIEISETTAPQASGDGADPATDSRRVPRRSK
jgi:hypothetical protein